METLRRGEIHSPKLLFPPFWPGEGAEDGEGTRVGERSEADGDREREREPYICSGAVKEKIQKINK